MTDESTSTTVELEVLEAPRLQVLRMPVRLDGRVTAYGEDTAGYGAFNAYLLSEGDDALLVDTGFPVAEQALSTHLRRSVREGSRLAIFPLRLGEFDSVSNTVAIAEQFGAHTVYGIQDNGLRWIDFRSPGEGGMLPGLRYEKVGSSAELWLGRPPTRRIEAIAPQLRLLQTHWLYDEATQTLLTSDSFGYVKPLDASGPWVIRSRDEDRTTPAQARRWLLGMRYWWLRGAACEHLRRDLHDIFDRFAVKRIAPAYGCVLEGHDVVARHVQLLDGLLAALGDEHSDVPQVAA